MWTLSFHHLPPVPYSPSSGHYLCSLRYSQFLAIIITIISQLENFCIFFVWSGLNTAFLQKPSVTRWKHRTLLISSHRGHSQFSSFCASLSTFVYFYNNITHLKDFKTFVYISIFLINFHGLLTFIPLMFIHKKSL